MVPTTSRADDPHALLASVERLRTRTRAAVRGAWFPLVVFGLITLATIPLYRRPFDYPSGGPFHSGPYTTPYYAGLPGARSQLLAFAFWLVAAPLGYALCAVWYRRRARRLGLSFRWERWIVAGGGLFALLVALYALPEHEFGVPSAAVDVQVGASAALSPLVAVAVGLLVLAWVERSWIVASAAALYGAFTLVVNTYGLGQIPPWINPPYGATKDFFIAPAHNVILLASLLFLGAGASVLSARRAGASA